MLPLTKFMSLTSLTNLVGILPLLSAPELAAGLDGLDEEAAGFEELGCSLLDSLDPWFPYAIGMLGNWTPRLTRA